MAFEPLTHDMNVIAKLGDNPNSDNSLSAQELKEKFDEAGVAIKKYLNEYLLPELAQAYAKRVPNFGWSADGFLGTDELGNVIIRERPVPEFSVGEVVVLEAGTPAYVTITGTNDNPILNLGIPKGYDGKVPGLTVGSVTTVEPGESAFAYIDGTAELPKLHLGLPQGTPGVVPEFTVGAVESLDAGAAPTATITGTEENPVLNLGIPKGKVPELKMGTVKTGEAGSAAEATIGGSTEEPVLNLSIPKGATGATPNLRIGTVETLEPGADATASVSGTAENPVLSLGIPRGASALYVTLTQNADTGVWSADKTFREIGNAYDAGEAVFCVLPVGTAKTILPLLSYDLLFIFGGAVSSSEYYTVTFFGNDITVTKTDIAGAADMGAAEGEPGHILNRTHWREFLGKDEILPETVFASSGQHSVLGYDLFSGVDKVVVVFDGTEYECAVELGSSADEGFWLYVGNKSLLSSQWADTGEPFLIWGYSGSNLYLLYSGNEGHTLAVEYHAYEYHTLPKEYLPDDLAVSDAQVAAAVAAYLTKHPVDAAGCENVKNVRDYGAAGDGVTDDTAAIASAVAALDTGETLYFPAGVYRVSNINLKSDMTVQGAGWSSVIQLLDNTSDYYGSNNCLNLANVENIIIRDIKLDGRGAQQAATEPAQDQRLNGIHIRKAHDITVENVWMYNNGYHGCIMTYAANVVFSRCLATGNGFRPIHGHTQIYNCRLTNCVCENNGLNLITGGSGYENDSIFFFGARDLVISDNIVKSNRRGCITVGCDQGTEDTIASGSIAITGNVCECYEDLEHIVEAESDTGVAKFPSQGIVVYGGNCIADNVTVTGNTVRNAHQGIYLYAQEGELTSINTVISGNSVQDCSYGIHATNVADVTVADNQFRGMGISWMYGGGLADWVVQGNNVDGTGNSDAALCRLENCTGCILQGNSLTGDCDYAFYAGASNKGAVIRDNTLTWKDVPAPIKNPGGTVSGNLYITEVGGEAKVCVDPYSNSGFVRETLINPNTTSAYWNYTAPVAITETDTMYELNTYVSAPVEYADPSAYAFSSFYTAIVFLRSTDLSTAVGIASLNNSNGDIVFSDTCIEGSTNNIWGVTVSISAEKVKELFPDAAYVMMQTASTSADPDNLAAAYHALNDGHAYVYRTGEATTVTTTDDYTRQEIDAMLGSYITDIDTLIGGDA